jgi:serine/threonine protein kinase
MASSSPLSNVLPILPSDRYTALHTLGKGAYASVVAALDKETGETVAVKIVKRSPPNIPLRSELDVITRLHKNGRNPNLVYALDR